MWPNRSFHFIRSLNRAKCIFSSRHHPQIHSIQRIWNIILCFDIYLFVFLLLAVGRHASMSNINYRQCCACWLIICSIFTTSLDSTRNFLFTILCWTWRKSGNEREIQKAFRKQQQSIHVYIERLFIDIPKLFCTDNNWMNRTMCVLCVCEREIAPKRHIHSLASLFTPTRIYSRKQCLICALPSQQNNIKFINWVVAIAAAVNSIVWHTFQFHKHWIVNWDKFKYSIPVIVRSFICRVQWNVWLIRCSYFFIDLY